jgi:acyl-CoA reductase-like NAD-dependent aldehyde dehydrogenase
MADRIPVSKTYKLYIGGKFPRTESGRYFALNDSRGTMIANVCQGSRKDFRNAVVAARKAQPGWAGYSAYLRGQILYRIAEMLESRRETFVAELELQGVGRRAAKKEVELSIDRLIHYAGWSDKYGQIFSAVNPVSSPHFNFSVPEPTGVVAIICPADLGLLGLVSLVAPAIVGGNTVVVLASDQVPLSAVSLGEVIHASDVPGGVVNILTGHAAELAPWFAGHMDVNALVYGAGAVEGVDVAGLQVAAAENLKRFVDMSGRDWSDADAQDPYLILDTQEIKTTWHPVEG